VRGWKCCMLHTLIHATWQQFEPTALKRRTAAIPCSSRVAFLSDGCSDSRGFWVRDQASAAGAPQGRFRVAGGVVEGAFSASGSHGCFLGYGRIQACLWYHLPRRRRTACVKGAEKCLCGPMPQGWF
jgi:hypothetical protein